MALKNGDNGVQLILSALFIASRKFSKSNRLQIPVSHSLSNDVCVILFSIIAINQFVTL